MGWIEDQSELTQGWPSPLTWAKLVEILSDPDAAEERNRATLYLRRLFKYAFAELRTRLEDPNDTETTWESLTCDIILHYPWSWQKSEGLIDYSEANPLGTPKELVPLILLTAGTAILKAGDNTMITPSMAVRSALDRLPKSQRDKWLDGAGLHDWVQYGDDKDGVRIQGFGAFEDFAAGLRLMISPRLIDSDSQESYYRVRASMPWTGSSPRAWPSQGQGALWKTVSIFLSQLIDEAEGSVERLKRPVVGIGGGGGSGFKALLGPDHDRFTERVATYTLDNTCWAGIPPYAIGIAGPSLDVLDDKNELAWDAILKIWAVMYFPGNELRRRQYVAAVRASVTANSRMQLDEISGQVEGVTLPAEDLATLLNGPSFSDLKREANALYAGGLIAGVMLRTTLSCAVHHRNLMGVNKAACIVGRMLRESGFANLGESKIKEKWSYFRPVAHLWAALICLEERLASGQVEEFLGLAEAYRAMGEGVFVPRSHKGPVLDPSQTWRIPPELAIQAVELSVPGLPSEYLEDS